MTRAAKPHSLRGGAMERRPSNGPNDASVSLRSIKLRVLSFAMAAAVATQCRGHGGSVILTANPRCMIEPPP
jgi:hypothetical protein